MERPVIASASGNTWTLRLDSGSSILLLVDEHAPIPRILDLGCGTSANLPLTPGSVSSITTVLISERDPSAIQGRRKPWGIHACVIRGCRQSSTYSTNRKYDAILPREVLYYFVPDQAAQPWPPAPGLAGFLEPGGKIFIQVFESVDEIVRSSGLSVLYRRAETTADGGPGAALLVLG